RNDTIIQLILRWKVFLLAVAETILIWGKRIRLKGEVFYKSEGCVVSLSRNATKHVLIYFLLISIFALIFTVFDTVLAAENEYLISEKSTAWQIIAPDDLDEEVRSWVSSNKHKKGI